MKKLTICAIAIAALAMTMTSCKKNEATIPDSINVTVEDLQASHSVRCAVSMYSIMKILKDKPYDAKNTKRVKKLFDLR